MTDTAPSYGDPTEWDEIPDAWYAAFEAAIKAHGWEITDAHESAITIDAPNLDEGEEWTLAKPNFHGMWAYGIYTQGYCANPEWIYADAADPQAIADVVHALLTEAPLKRTWIAGAHAVWPATPTAD